MRELKYSDALYEAMYQEMERDENVFVYGLGVQDENAIFGSMGDIYEKFGDKRCIDMPLSEDSMMGFGIGSAINGLKPIYIHIRVDFLLLAMNQLVNMASTYHYMTGLQVPLVIRAIIGRGWGQGMQHSKSMQATFAHVPGLKVVMPTTAYDAKGLLISAIKDPNPVLLLEHRWLYWAVDNVPKERYEVPIGKSIVRKEGKDLTIVATSWMNVEAKRAIDIFEKEYPDISIELIDPLTISPLDVQPMVESARKTGKVIIVDNDWVNCGFSAELATQIYDRCSESLLRPIKRLGFAETPCPTVRCLEDEFYPNVISILREIENLCFGGYNDPPRIVVDNKDLYSHENKFKGPF